MQGSCSEIGFAQRLGLGRRGSVGAKVLAWEVSCQTDVEAGLAASQVVVIPYLYSLIPPFMLFFMKGGWTYVYMSGLRDRG